MVYLLVLYLKIRPLKKVRFRSWTILEELSIKLEKAIETNISQFPEFVNSYVSIAFSIPKTFIQKLPWVVVIQLFNIARQYNTPTKIPLLITKEKTKIEKPVGWDYDGRSWFYSSHLLAKSYGWSVKYIENLDVNSALSYLQEIYVEEQLDREFLWGMSEIAYPYDKITKESKFKPLPRPYFMQSTAPEIVRIKIPKAFIPMGIVNDRSKMEKYFQEKEKDKEFNSI